MTQRKRSIVEYWRLGARCLFVSGPERELLRIAGQDLVLTAYHARFGPVHAAVMFCESQALLDRLLARMSQAGHGSALDHLIGSIDRDRAVAIVAWLHRSVRPTDRHGSDTGFAALIERLAESHLLGSASITLHRIGGRRLVAGMIFGSVPISPADPATSRWPGGEGPASIRACEVWSAGGDTRSRTCVIIAVPQDMPEKADILLANQQGFVRLAAKVIEHDGITAFCAATGRAGSEMLATLAACDEDWRTEAERHLERQAGAPGLTSSRHGLQLYIDSFVAMPHGVYLAGRVIDPDGMIGAIALLDGTLQSTDVTALMHERRILISTGKDKRTGSRFHAFLPRKDNGLVRHAVEIAIGLRDGGEVLIPLRMADRTLKGMRSAILDSFAGAKLLPDTFSAIIRPALEPLQQRIAARIHVHAVEELGTAFRRSVSIIVPLYRETGFIVHQLMAFSADPVIRDEAEIIYCVDDPAIEDEVRIILTGWRKIWPLDLRLVVLNENAGYGLANNLAVGVASAPVIVLMNSDVVPERPGWLEPMRRELAALPAFSILGPKLLYADGTLQHAGMSFHKLPSGLWQNVHPGKGQGRDDRIARTNRDVPAVTGALMVTSRADFLAVGGFSPEYISGDYEDSDLCLRLRAQGGRCRYVAAATLYHFERQSIGDDSDDLDRGTTIHNRLLQHTRWSAAIAALGQDHPEIGDA